MSCEAPMGAPWISIFFKSEITTPLLAYLVIDQLKLSGLACSEVLPIDIAASRSSAIASKNMLLGFCRLKLIINAILAPWKRMSQEISSSCLPRSFLADGFGAREKTCVSHRKPWRKAPDCTELTSDRSNEVSATFPLTTWKSSLARLVFRYGKC